MPHTLSAKERERESACKRNTKGPNLFPYTTDDSIVVKSIKAWICFCTFANTLPVGCMGWMNG